MSRFSDFEEILFLLNKKGRLLDLGCGPCMFCYRAMDNGFDVTGVDVRTDRIPENLPFPVIESDIRHVDFTPYDIISCLGVFYHLTFEDQVHLLGKCKDKMLILDTHYTNRNDVKMGEYEGTYFDENLENTRASWGNKQSFWHTEESLYRFMKDHGFKLICKKPEHSIRRRFLLYAG